MWIIISFDFFDFDFLDFFFFGLIFSSFEFSLKLSRVLFGIVIEECSCKTVIAARTHWNSSLKPDKTYVLNVPVVKMMKNYHTWWFLGDFLEFRDFFVLYLSSLSMLSPLSSWIESDPFENSRIIGCDSWVCRATHLRLLPAVT